MLEPVAHARKLGLVILDACRTNPFPMARGTHYIPRGLARVEPSRPRLLVAFAARHGEEAVDGPAGGNGPYAKALAKYLAAPGLEVHIIFRAVQEDVLAATGGRQRPYVYGLLPPEPLYFGPPVVSEAALAWLAIQSSTRLADFEAFRDRHGKSDPFSIGWRRRVSKR